MYRKDYILTMIEQFSYFLARLLFLKESGRQESAIVEINDFCGKLFEATSDELMRMPNIDLVERCSEHGELVPDQAIALGCLLRELGDLHESLGAPRDVVCGSYRRALFLLVTVYGDGTRALPLEAVERMESVIDRIGSCDLDAELALLLVRHFEYRCEYAAAEDLIFELAEAGVPGAIDAGLAFYERLGALMPSMLAAGGLSAEEVAESVAQLVELRSAEGSRG